MMGWLFLSNSSFYGFFGFASCVGLSSFFTIQIRGVLWSGDNMAILEFLV